MRNVWRRFGGIDLKAVEILRQKNVTGDLIIEMAIWQLPAPLPSSHHKYKYRLYCGRAGRCLVRYDNERGKGDHVHYSVGEISYTFLTLTQLIADFEADVQRLVGGE